MVKKLTLEDRRKIEQMWKDNASPLKIAAELGISPIPDNKFHSRNIPGWRVLHRNGQYVREKSIIFLFLPDHIQLF